MKEEDKNRFNKECEEIYIKAFAEAMAKEMKKAYDAFLQVDPNGTPDDFIAFIRKYKYFKN